MKSPKHYPWACVGGLYFLVVTPFIWADTANGFFPYLPRLSTLILAGSHSTGRPDLMLPAFGNSDEVLFLNAQGKSNFDTAWFASLGMGYRQTYQDKRILGAYVFADRNISPQNNTFWFVSPGLESLGQVWDFRVNGYVPASTQREFVSSNFASDTGDYSYVGVSGHEQYDTIVNSYEEVGWGADAEIGRTIPHLPGLRVYVGGYHFNLNNSDDINGVAGRFEYPITSRIALNFRDSYDNQQHNSAVVGVRFTLGGLKKTPHDPRPPIQQRLLDPVERNMSTLTQGTAEPVVSEQEYEGYDELQEANIWFFDDNSMSAYVDDTSCTAEHPCASTSFNQNTINEINASNREAVFYFKPGEYSSLTNGHADVLNNDQLYGRSEDYTQPEQSATFVGGLELKGKSLLDSIILVNDADQVQTVALSLDAESSVILNDVKIGVDDSSQGQAYSTGIVMNNSTLNVMGNSEIHAFADAGNVSGIAATGQNTINLNASLIEANSSDPNSLVVRGISVIGSGTNTVSLIDSNINVNALGSSGTVEADGIYMSGDANIINLQNSTISAQANNSSGFGLAYGVNANASGDNTINVTQGHIIANSFGSTSSQVFGISSLSSSGNNTLTVNNANINAGTSSTGNSAGAQGISVSAANNIISISNSLINATATGNYLSSVFGIAANASNENTFAVTNSSITATALSTNPIGMANAIGINSIATATSGLMSDTNTFNVTAQAASYSAQQICINNVCS